MEVVEDLLLNVRAGAGTAALIEGPAGIGKTEILSASREAAVSAGLPVLSARGIELEEAFSFGVASQLLTAPVARASPELRSQLLSGAAGHAAPLLEPKTPSPEPVPGTDPSFTLQHGLYWVCANLAAEGPIVLSVDDAHWADAQSLRWLDFLVKRIEELPVLLLMTARTGEGSSGSAELESVRSDSSVRRLQPAPLTAQSSERLLRERLSLEADADFYAECRAVTGGNPLLLGELVRALEAGLHEGRDLSASRVRQIGPEAIARHATVRAAGVSRDAVELTKAVAVLNGGAELELATRIAELDGERAAELADALAAVGVLKSERPLGFVHPIVRAAIYSEIPTAERARLHRRAAALLIERGAPPEQPGAHLLQTEPSSDPGIVEALEAGAEVALSRGAAQTAKDLMERALQEPPPPAARAHILLKLARAQFNLFEETAVDRMREAISLLGDARERAEATDSLVSVLTIHGRVLEAIEVISSALEEDHEMDPDIELSLRAQLIALARQQPETAHLAVEHRLRLPRDLPGDTHGERMALAMIAFEDGIAGEPMASLEEIVDRAGGGGALYTGSSTGTAAAPRSPLMTVVHSCHFLSMVYGDRLAPAEAIAEKALTTVTAQGRAAATTVVSYWRATLFLRQGRVPEAIAEAQTILDIARTSSSPAVMLLATALLVTALVEQGDHPGAERALSDLGLSDDIPPTTPFETALRARGQLRIAQGQLEDGVEDLLASWALLEQVGVLVPGYSHSRGHAAVAVAALGDRSRATELAHADLELVRRSGVPSAIGVALRLAGLAEGGAKGLAQLRQAVTTLEGSPVRLERARALVDLGAALRRGNQRSEAREYLRMGLELADACGASVLAERAREELAATGARPRNEFRRGVDALTPSELRVAAMAAERRTNKEIAQALFVTLRTVETHLTHAFQKLDITSRKELSNALSA